MARSSRLRSMARVRVDGEDVKRFDEELKEQVLGIVLLN